MTNEDQAHALFVAAANWIAQIANAHGAELAGMAPGGRVDVRISDVAGERPRIELFVGDALVGHTQLLRGSAGRPN